jgi:hypothetical protein
MSRHAIEIISDFVSCVNEHISMLRFPASAVVNIDETNIDFDMPASTTLERRGVRSVSVRIGSTQRATVLLGVVMDGSKLPPFIVFKGQRSGFISREITGDVIGRGYPAGVVMSVQSSGWMDEQLMLEWVDRMWKRWIAQRGVINSASLLITDRFAGHMVQSVVNAIGICGTDIEFIVGGYTSKLQVLDVRINRPFKVHAGNCFERFLVSNTVGSKPTRSDVANWIAHAWSEITMIRS